jgi:hypothetical protein
MVFADLLFVGSDQSEGRCYHSGANLNSEIAIKRFSCIPPSIADDSPT